MQPIEPAPSLTAVLGVMAAPTNPTPKSVEKAAPAEIAAQRTADVAAFGNDTFAVFSVDKDTGAMRIAIFDGNGRLVRMIPPKGVADMLAQISAYRRLR